MIAMYMTSWQFTSIGSCANYIHWPRKTELCIYGFKIRDSPRYSCDEEEDTMDNVI
jgi:hypothetical protein